MNHTNSLFFRMSDPGLWLMKSRNIVDDIGRHIHDLAVDGGLFLQVYSPHKDRIVSNVISMIIKDLLLDATDPDERYRIEKDISHYYECGHFAELEKLNDYIPKGSFWEEQVRIQDFDPLFLSNCANEQAILIDGLDVFVNEHDPSSIDKLLLANSLALQEKKSVFVFVHKT